MRMNNFYLRVIALAVLVKLILLLVGFVSYSNFPFSEINYTQNFHYPNHESNYIKPFKTWDAQHYLFLSEKGYTVGNESNRFFPLFPILISVVSFFLKNTLVSSYILVTVLSIISLILLYKLTQKLFPKKNIYWTTLLFLLSFPTAFYLSLPYSESLFLFLALAFFYTIETKKRLLSFAISFLLPLSRPTGILIIVPIFYKVVKSSYKTLRIQTFNNPIKITFPRESLYLLGPMLGLLFYLFLNRILLGEFNAGISGISSIASWNLVNLFDPGSLIKNLLNTNLSIHGFQNSLIDRLFFVSFLVFLPAVYKKLPKQYFYYTLAIGLVPLLGSFTSYMRYILPAFPIFITLALLFSDSRMRFLKYIVLFIFFVFQMVLFSLHILNYWVS